MVAVAQHLAERGEQSLIFLPDKDSTRRMVWRLDGKVDLPKAEKAIEELQKLEVKFFGGLLIMVLEDVTTQIYSIFLDNGLRKHYINFKMHFLWVSLISVKFI